MYQTVKHKSSQTGRTKVGPIVRRHQSTIQSTPSDFTDFNEIVNVE